MVEFVEVHLFISLMSMRCSFVVLHSPPPGQNAPSLGSPGVGSRNRGLLQDGDIEGVRQLNVNIPIIQDATEADINAWRNRTIVPKLKESEAK
jgi:hypothetical protein